MHYSVAYDLALRFGASIRSGERERPVYSLTVVALKGRGSDVLRHPNDVDARRGSEGPWERPFTQKSHYGESWMP